MSDTDMNLPMVKVARERHERRLRLQRKALRVTNVISITCAYFLIPVPWASVTLAVVIAVGLVGDLALERWQKRQANVGLGGGRG